MAERLVIPGKRIKGTNIWVLNRGKLDAIKPGTIKHAASDTDGTFSTLRRLWELIMEPMMVEMILGGQAIDPAWQAAIQQEVDRYIDESTGINTILQMAWLVKAVRRYGLVPKDKIRRARGYKAEYNRRLMVPVRERIRQLESGALQITDVTILGALPFVQALSEHVDIHVFSGTDHKDVVNELTALGIAQYVQSIHGAKRSYKDSNKEKVLRDLMRQFGLSGLEVVVIGDGKVEITVGAEAGCLTIGVASDEETGCGWNPAKVERLVAAGADVLIPDFSCHQALFRHVLKLAA